MPFLRVSPLVVVVICGLSGSVRATNTPDVRFEIDPRQSDGRITLSVVTTDPEVQGWSVGLCHDPEAARIVDVSISEDLATFNLGGPPDFYVAEEASAPPFAGVVQAVVLSHFANLRLPPSEEDGFPVLNVEYEVFGETELITCDDLVGNGQPVQTVFTVAGETVRPTVAATATLAPKPYAEQLAYRIEPPEASEVLTVVLYGEEVEVEGWSFALCHTTENATIVEIATSPALEQINGGEPPEFVLNDIVDVPPFTAVTQSVLLGTALEPVRLGPFPDGLPLLGIRYEITDDDTLKFCDQVGDVTFSNHVLVDGVGYVPAERANGRLIRGGLGTTFVRGDADLDGTLRMSDGVLILMALFRGAGPLPCLDAADSNDVGRIDLSDAIYIFRYLYSGGPPPPPPFPDPGEDLSPQTALGCERGL